MLSDYFPAARRPMALQVFSLGAPIGAWLGSQVAGAIAYRFGWRAMFLALGIPGILIGALVLLTIREPRARLSRPWQGLSDATPFLETMRFMLRQPSAMHLIIGSCRGRVVGLGPDVVDAGFPDAQLRTQRR